MTRPLAVVALIGLVAGLGPARAAGLQPLGSLEIEIGGTVEAMALVGSLKAKTEEQSGSYDFLNKAELQINATGEDEGSGLRYGARIELEATTDEEFNADEMWLFVEGWFGELRFGDDDGASIAMAVGGYTVAVGTGGTDGDEIDTPDVVSISETGAATKISYYTPELGAWRFGLSYTPSSFSFGQDIAQTDDGSVGDLLEVGSDYYGAVGEVDLIASLVGAVGRYDSDLGTDSRGAWGVEVGLLATYAATELAGNVGTEDFGGFERTWINLGVAREIERWRLSINYGQVIAAAAPDDLKAERPWNVVLGAELAVAPGLVASLEVSWFDDSRINEDGTDYLSGDNGTLALGRLALVF